MWAWRKRRGDRMPPDDTGKQRCQRDVDVESRCGGQLRAKASTSARSSFHKYLSIEGSVCTYKREILATTLLKPKRKLALQAARLCSSPDCSKL